MEFEFNLPSSFWEKCFPILIGLQYATLAERSKVNLEFWNLFIAIVSLGLTYQVKILTLALTVFKKTFQIFFQFKCIR